MAYSVKSMLYLADLYFTDGEGNYRFQWTNKAFADKVKHPGAVEDDSSYYQDLAKYEYMSEHLNDGSGNAQSYRITIYSEETEEAIYSIVTDDFSVSVSLGKGEYLWEVEALDKYGNVITVSEQSYVNTSFDNWEDEPDYIYFKDSSADRFMAHAGDYYNHIRWAVGGAIFSKDGETTDYFTVCGPGLCGNEEAWQIPLEEGYSFSVSNAFGGFGGEFALTGSCMVTCGGIYEYEDGRWNYKMFTAPWFSCTQQGGTTDYLFTEDGGLYSNVLYKWDTENDTIVKVLTAEDEIYCVSDRYYVIQDGVYSIEDNEQILARDVIYGENPVFNDMYLHVYAKNASGRITDVLEKGETGSIAVKYYFFDAESDQIIEKEIELFSGTAPILMDSEEIFDQRIGNCITFIIGDESDDDEISPKKYAYIHEIGTDGSVTVHDFTCNTYTDDLFSVNDEGKLVSRYYDIYKGYREDVFHEITLNFAYDLFADAEKVSIGDKNGLSFESVEGTDFTAAYSQDGFSTALVVEVEAGGLATYGLPAGEYTVRLSGDGGATWSVSQEIVSDNTIEPQELVSDADGVTDLFFAQVTGLWEKGYAAEHHGFVSGWTGSREKVLLEGKNKISNVFCGSEEDNSILVLTDDANGDALFVEDIYTALGNQARISQIGEIRAGAGDDIIDMTSQIFSYNGSEMTIRGGSGDDVIWAAGGDNDLFGDEGNDRIIGSAGFDLIVGGTGDDIMHSGGGNDIFAFGADWGNDTITITDNAYVTLWFSTDFGGSWDPDKRIYRCGDNSVTVTGDKNSVVTLKFGNEGGQYADMLESGAFESYTSVNVFEAQSKAAGAPELPVISVNGLDMTLDGIKEELRDEEEERLEELQYAGEITFEESRELFKEFLVANDACSEDIEGTGSNDKITILPGITHTVWGTIDLHDGDDQLILSAVDTDEDETGLTIECSGETSIDFGNGNDQLLIQKRGDLEGCFVKMKDGDDIFYIDDCADGVELDHFHTEANLDFGNGNDLFYMGRSVNEIEIPVIDFGSGDDTAEFRPLESNGDFVVDQIFFGTGNDTMKVSGTPWSDAESGNGNSFQYLDFGDGTDTLVLDGTLTAEHIYGLENVTGSGTVAFLEADSVSLKALKASGAELVTAGVGFTTKEMESSDDTLAAARVLNGHPEDIFLWLAGSSSSAAQGEFGFVDETDCFKVYITEEIKSLGFSLTEGVSCTVYDQNGIQAAANEWYIEEDAFKALGEYCYLKFTIASDQCATVSFHCND